MVFGFILGFSGERVLGFRLGFEDDWILGFWVSLGGLRNEGWDWIGHRFDDEFGGSGLRLGVFRVRVLGFWDFGFWILGVFVEARKGGV